MKLTLQVGCRHKLGESNTMHIPLSILRICAGFRRRSILDILRFVRLPAESRYPRCPIGTLGCREAENSIDALGQVRPQLRLADRAVA